MLRESEVYGTGEGSFLMAAFDISGVETLGSATRELASQSANLSVNAHHPATHPVNQLHYLICSNKQPDSASSSIKVSWPHYKLVSACTSSDAVQDYRI
jgi:hypothetical protein